MELNLGLLIGKKMDGKPLLKNLLKISNYGKELDQEIKKHQIEWQWVKGHAGNIHNEKADFLARKYIED